jgi:hypothetical protein
MSVDASIYRGLDIPDPMAGANAIGLYQQGKQNQIDQKNKLAALAQQQEMQGYALNDARRKEAAIPQQQADASRNREADYMRGVSSEIAQNPQAATDILNKHKSLAPQTGIDPTHFDWLAKDLLGSEGATSSQMASPDEVAKKAFMHSLTQEQVNKLQFDQMTLKPTFNADAGGYVYPPNSQNPNGRVVTPQGFTPKVIETPEQKRAADLEKSKELIRLTASLRPAQAPDATMALSSDAVEVAAQRYLTDGTLPPMGMGKNGAVGRAAILNHAADIAKGAGDSPESQRVTQLANKSSASALNQLQKQQTMVSAFEKNATKNADMALALSDQVDRTGVPVFNSWIQAGQKNVTGNPQVSQFHAATETFVNEYAKIMSGSMGNTAVSDSARAHAHSLLSTAQSKEQYKAVVSTLKQEMGNRMSGFEDEKKSLLQSMTRQSKPSQVNGHPQDNEAVNWAKLNPNDPRASAILKANGVQ